MSEGSRVLDAPAEHNKVGPDYFGFYTCEVAELLSLDEDFLPFSSQTSDLAGRTCEVVRDKDITKHRYSGKESNSFPGSGSLFCNGIGGGLSDFKKERLKALLQESVVALTQEVDETLDPVLAMCRIQSYLRYKKGLLSHSGAANEGDAGQHPHKKLKLSSSSSSISVPLHASHVNCRVSEEDSGHEHRDVALPGKEISNYVKKTCAHCHTMESSKWRNGPEGPKCLCNACGIKFEQGKDCFSMNDQKRESCFNSNIGAGKENGEVDDDLQFLLENDGLKVEETMKKYSDELSATVIF